MNALKASGAGIFFYLYFFFQWEGCSNSLQLLWDDYTETQLLCCVCLLTHEIMPFCPSESQAHGMGGAWQKYTPKDKDGWKDSDTTDSTQQQSSVVMPKAAREMKYEHLKLKYLFIDKMWIFLIFWIINPPSGKSVKKLWDFFTASSLVWGWNMMIQACICRWFVPSKAFPRRDQEFLLKDRSPVVLKAPAAKFPLIKVKDH